MFDVFVVYCLEWVLLGWVLIEFIDNDRIVGGMS